MVIPHTMVAFAPTEQPRLKCVASYKACRFTWERGLETLVRTHEGPRKTSSSITGTVIDDDVFLGPSCVLTNVSNPRSQVKRHALYEATHLRRGCSVGANATIVCGITIGRYAFVGAGSVVTRNVAD